MKTDGHLGRCHFKDREGDAANVILTAVGHNLRRVLAWLRALLRSVLLALGAAGRSMMPSRSPMPAPPQRLHSTARPCGRRLPMPPSKPFASQLQAPRPTPPEILPDPDAYFCPILTHARTAPDDATWPLNVRMLG